MRSKAASTLVSFSGGKDSWAVAELALEAGLSLSAFYMYFVRGLEVDEAPVDRAERRYGIKILRVPHWALATYFRRGIFCDALIGPKISTLKQIDIEVFARERTGTEWIALGHRMDDSLERRAMLHRISGFDEQARRIYPLWTWSARDVFAYLGMRRVPVPAQSMRLRSNGVNLFDPTYLAWLRDEHPNDWEKVLLCFPHVEAVLWRHEHAS